MPKLLVIKCSYLTILNMLNNNYQLGDIMEYTIPIYLDTDLLLDLLASLEDGFTTVKRITTSENNKQNTTNQGNIGISFGQLFNFGFGRSKDSSASVDNGSKIEKYYTYGSMMNKLLNRLNDDNLVKKLIDEDSWKQLEISDFVEIQGKFKPNPLSDSFNKIQEMIDLIIKITEIDNKTNENVINGNDADDLRKELKSIEEIFQPISKSLEKQNSQKYIVEINSEYSCILNIFNEYIRDNSGLELPYGNFRVLGKVIKKIGNDEEYSLFEETPFASNDDLFEALMESLESINEQIKLPKINININNCIQIIPIAIYV